MNWQNSLWEICCALIRISWRNIKFNSEGYTQFVPSARNSSGNIGSVVLGKNSVSAYLGVSLNSHCHYEALKSPCNCDSRTLFDLSVTLTTEDR